MPIKYFKSRACYRITCLTAPFAVWNGVLQFHCTGTKHPTANWFSLQSTTREDYPLITMSEQLWWLSPHWKRTRNCVSNPPVSLNTSMPTYFTSSLRDYMLYVSCDLLAQRWIHLQWPSYSWALQRCISPSKCRPCRGARFEFLVWMPFDSSSPRPSRRCRTNSGAKRPSYTPPLSS